MDGAIQHSARRHFSDVEMQREGTGCPKRVVDAWQPLRLVQDEKCSLVDILNLDHFFAGKAGTAPSK